METIALKIEGGEVTGYRFGNDVYLSQILSNEQLQQVQKLNPVEWAGDHFRLKDAPDA